MTVTTVSVIENGIGIGIGTTTTAHPPGSTTIVITEETGVSIEIDEAVKTTITAETLASENVNVNNIMVAGGRMTDPDRPPCNLIVEPDPGQSLQHCQPLIGDR